MSELAHHYIITIHNPGDVLRSVLNAIERCAGKDSVIVPVLDGCTDESAEIVAQFKRQSSHKVIPIETPDIHEIGAINAALRITPPGGVFLVQDDVVLMAPNLEVRLQEKISTVPEIGYVSLRMGGNLRVTGRLLNFLQQLKYRKRVGKMVSVSDMVVSQFDEMTTDYRSRLQPWEFREVQAGIKSPVWISPKLRRLQGSLDHNLMPYCYDDVDLSITALRAGLRNFVFAAPHQSKKAWGGTRKPGSSFHRDAGHIVMRNRQFLYRKHESYLSRKDIVKEEGILTVVSKRLTPAYRRKTN